MFRTSRMAALGLIIGLTTFVACGGGGEAGAGQEEAAASEASSGQDMAQSQPAAQGEEMQGQQGQAMLPEGVTEEMVKEGQGIFSGAGMCNVCHGPDAKGQPGLGADLTDSEWLHSDGSYDAIVQTIMNGVTAEASTNGTAMPAKGGSTITDDQVKAVAAYVYSLSHKGG